MSLQGLPPNLESLRVLVNGKVFDKLRDALAKEVVHHVLGL